MRKVRCTIMRGGTSKALFFLEKDLPPEPSLREELILRAFGSPDPYGKQIDGLGGATPSTSKVAIIEKRLDERNAVNYTFGQVDVTSSAIDMKGNCGNVSSAVGPFAIDAGLIDDVTEPISIVKIYNTNTAKYIVAYVPVKDGKTLYKGNYTIAGVPNAGSKICLDFINPGGAITGNLLPTNKVKERIQTESYGNFEISIVDAANPIVFIDSNSLRLSGDELPCEIDNSPTLLNTLEEIRSAAAVKIGLAEDIASITVNNPVYPFICIVAEAKTYVSSSEKQIQKNEIDIIARMVAVGKAHLTFAITGGISLAVASKIQGSIVNEKISLEKRKEQEIRIGHPSGVMDVGAEVIEDESEWKAIRGSTYRTARKLMSGDIYVW